MPYTSRLWRCFLVAFPIFVLAGVVSYFTFGVPEMKADNVAASIVIAICWLQAYYLGSYLTTTLIPPTKLILFPKPWYPDPTAFGLVFHTLASNVFSLRLAEGRWSLGPARDKRAMLCRMEDNISQAHEAVQLNQLSLAEEAIADTIIEIMDFSAGFSLNIGELVEARIARMKTELDEQSAPAVPEKLPPQGLNDV